MGLSEGVIRLGVFASVFLLMALLETFFPRRDRAQLRRKRWVANWGLVMIDTLALRIFVPVLALGAALYAVEHNWGLFAFIDWPFWLEAVLSFLLLDMAIYGQHVASHQIPLLWRLHKVHHTDRDIDVTTAIRFHPAEILLSMGFKLICVVLIGPPAVAVFLFEVVLNASAMFNHANVRLPVFWDKLLRAFVVTPDMHRVHHSTLHRETDSNYGFFLSCWDRVFRTYIAQPEKGHQQMTIGIEEHQTQEPSSLWWALFLPFRAPSTLAATRDRKEKE